MTAQITEFIIQRPHMKYKVRFTEDKHPNPSIDRMWFDSEGFWVMGDHDFIPDEDARYTKTYDSREKFEAAKKRMAKKSI